MTVKHSSLGVMHSNPCVSAFPAKYPSKLQPRHSLTAKHSLPGAGVRAIDAKSPLKTTAKHSSPVAGSEALPPRKLEGNLHEAQSGFRKKEFAIGAWNATPFASISWRPFLTDCCGDGLSSF